MAPTRLRYEIDLTTIEVSPPRSPALRRLGPADRDQLAALMLDAYAGTIDDEGETLADAEAEVDQWLADTPMLDHSFGAVIDDDLVAAVLVMELDQQPFVAIVMTAADRKGAGWGRAVVGSALAALQRDGHRRVALVITRGNTPSERLFTGLGAVTVG